MKQILTAIVLMSISLYTTPLLGYTDKYPSENCKIKNYRDIPNITAQEINAIEKLKSSGKKFKYACMVSTEAFESHDGSYDGFTPLLCKLLTELFGMEFEIALCDWDELMGYEDKNGNYVSGRLELKEFDFTGELTPTGERAEKGFIMSKPVTERLLRIFTDTKSVINNESEVNGLTLGFLEGTTTEEAVRTAYPKLKFNSVNTVANYKTAADMIALGPEHGGIDAFVDEATADPAFNEYGAVSSKYFFTLVNSPISMITLNPDLKPVISAFDKYLAAGGMKKMRRLYREGDFRYNKNKLYNSFSDAEKEFIRDGPSISVALHTDNYPISFYNKKEADFQGIAVDILQEISWLTGLQFKPVAPENANCTEIDGKFEKNELHMIGQLIKTDKREETFLFSDIPYAKCNYAIISRADYPEVTSYQIGNTTVGILEEEGRIDAFKRFFGGGGYITFPSHSGQMNALENGKIDLVMGSEYTLLAQTNYHEKTGLKINFEINETLDSYFGFNPGNETLQSIVNKTLALVNTEDIEKQWMGKSFDYLKKYAESRAFITTILLCAILAVLTCTIFLYVRTLKMGVKLKEYANFDSLTGILNRRHFIELCLSHITRSMRTDSESFVIIFDLDHFKQVNDNYGHSAGDKVLKEIAERVKNIIRPYDVFGRYGGEEFIIYMPELDKPNVMAAAERVRKAICATPVMFDNVKIRVTASFGIAFVTPGTKEVSAATMYADKALYQAKKTGRNKVVFYEQDSVLVQDMFKEGAESAPAAALE